MVTHNERHESYDGDVITDRTSNESNVRSIENGHVIKSRELDSMTKFER